MTSHLEQHSSNQTEKNSYYFYLSLILLFLLTTCSKMNSIEEFNEELCVDQIRGFTGRTEFDICYQVVDTQDSINFHNSILQKVKNSSIPDSEKSVIINFIQASLVLVNEGILTFYHYNTTDIYNLARSDRFNTRDTNLLGLSPLGIISTHSLEEKHQLSKIHEIIHTVLNALRYYPELTSADFKEKYANLDTLADDEFWTEEAFVVWQELILMQHLYSDVSNPLLDRKIPGSEPFNLLDCQKCLIEAGEANPTSPNWRMVVLLREMYLEQSYVNVYEAEMILINDTPENSAIRTSYEEKIRQHSARLVKLANELKKIQVSELDKDIFSLLFKQKYLTMKIIARIHENFSTELFDFFIPLILEDSENSLSPIKLGPILSETLNSRKTRIIAQTFFPRADRFQVNQG